MSNIQMYYIESSRCLYAPYTEWWSCVALGITREKQDECEIENENIRGRSYPREACGGSGSRFSYMMKYVKQYMRKESKSRTVA